MAGQRFSCSGASSLPDLQSLSSVDVGYLEHGTWISVPEVELQLILSRANTSYIPIFYLHSGRPGPAPHVWRFDCARLHEGSC